MGTFYKKHTVIPVYGGLNLSPEHTEAVRTKDSLVEWTMTDEQRAEVIAKYGAPKEPLRQKKKGGIPW